MFNGLSWLYFQVYPRIFGSSSSSAFICLCLVLLTRRCFSVALWSARAQCGAAATALTVLEETATIQYGQTHDFVFAAQSGVRYDVDVRVGEGSVSGPAIWVLPPGATDTSQAVATEKTIAADKGLGFTAAATGDFTARVTASEGSGPVTLTATAVGTAEHRSPPLRADGRPHPLEVSCHFGHCAFGYDGASAYDGDGSGFDLVRDCFGLTVVTCS